MHAYNRRFTIIKVGLRNMEFLRAHDRPVGAACWRIPNRLLRLNADVGEHALLASFFFRFLTLNHKLFEVLLL